MQSALSNAAMHHLNFVLTLVPQKEVAATGAPMGAT